MILQAKKTLFHNDGTESFTKGKMYQTESWGVGKLTSSIRVKNNQDEDHLLGVWAKHFKKM